MLSACPQLLFDFQVSRAGNYLSCSSLKKSLIKLNHLFSNNEMALMTFSNRFMVLTAA